jgi:ribosomal protein S18 acetylase RimI-like enzyme
VIVTTPESLPIRVRPAAAQDNVLLAEIGAETFFDAFGSANTPEDMEMYLKSSFSPEIQAAELADGGTRFLVAEVGAETVGYARLRTGKAPEAVRGARPIEIVRFYARNRWIGRRVGAALMAECLKTAATMGCDTIWLDVWEENERARAFYARWGFADVGTQAFRLGRDIQRDLLMQRPVRLAEAG